MRQRFPALATAVALAFFSVLPAQAQPERLLSIGAGANFQQFSDALFNGQRYQGVVPGGQLELQSLGKSETQLFTLAADVGNLQNRFAYPMLSIDARLGYGYAPRWAAWHDERLRFYLGGMGGAAYALRQFSWEDSDHVYWFTRYELSALAMAQLDLPAGAMLAWQAELPLVALVSRPAADRLYNNDKPTPGYLLAKINEGLTGVTALDYRAIATRLSYVFPLAPRWKQSLSYELRVSSTPYPEPLGDLHHGVTTRTSFSF